MKSFTVCIENSMDTWKEYIVFTEIGSNHFVQPRGISVVNALKQSHWHVHRKKQ